MCSTPFFHTPLSFTIPTLNTTSCSQIFTLSSNNRSEKTLNTSISFLFLLTLHSKDLSIFALQKLFPVQIPECVLLSSILPLVSLFARSTFGVFGAGLGIQVLWFLSHWSSEIINFSILWMVILFLVD